MSLYLKTLLLSLTLLMLTFESKTIAKDLDNNEWWNNWSYREKIDIPIDTSLSESKYQPIDIRVEFKEPCWVEDENHYSIRVICQSNGELVELESQIYDLHFIDDSHIDSCGVVFLIPGFADGEEEYYVYYDDTEKPAPNYTDHVKVEESYYRYEPIPGYPLESLYYKIIDDGFVIYTIAQQGHFMGYSTGQHITKMKRNIKLVSPQNGELFAAFDFRYCYDIGLFDYSSTSQKLLSKEIIVDGNLMVQMRITSTSNREDLETTAIYTYYHSPSNESRIRIHVTHRVLEDVKVYPDVNTDGIFSTLQCGGVKSSSIKELNMGKILPYLHLYNENNHIMEFSIDEDPEYIPEDPDIRVIRWSDDIDLGSPAWVSFDEGEKGKAHGIIFDTQEVLQVNAFEMDYPHLPGLENNLAAIQIGRNSYELGGIHSLSIPRGFSIEFNAEFFSTEQRGYIGVNREADLFTKLIKLVSINSFGEEETEEKERHTLTSYIHLAPSIPLGVYLSALTGLNLSYITAELYHNGEFISSKTVGRTTFKTPTTRSKLLIPHVDWCNLSFFKKTVFSNLDKGIYIIKVYRENPPLKDNRSLIGLAIVNLSSDTTIHIYCTIGLVVKTKLLNQYNNSLTNAKVEILYSDIVIESKLTGVDGEATLDIPLFYKFNLRVTYKGFIVYNNSFKTKPVNIISPPVFNIKINTHSLILRVLDKLGLPIEVELNPWLSNQDVNIYPDTYYNNIYYFHNLPTPKEYILHIKYKSWILNNSLSISSDNLYTVVFPVEHKIKIRLLDTHGLPMNIDEVTLSRGDRNLYFSNDEFLLPPGKYKLIARYNKEIIAQRNIQVFSDRVFNIVTYKNSSLPIWFHLTSLTLLILSIYSFIKKSRYRIGFSLLLISILLSSLVLPWWSIYGYTSNGKVSTNLYMFPLKLVTLVDIDDVKAGETSFLPEEFQLYAGLIPILLILVCLSLVISLFSKRYLYIYSFIIILIVASMLIFLVGVSLLVGVGVGTLIGSKTLPVSIPGDESIELLCRWGPNIGFLLFSSSIPIMMVLLKQFNKWNLPTRSLRRFITP